MFKLVLAASGMILALSFNCPCPSLEQFQDHGESRLVAWVTASLAYNVVQAYVLF